MRNRWVIQTEKGIHSTEAVWAAVEKSSGKRTAALVVGTSSKAALAALATGMFYLDGPGLKGSVLFRIQSSRRARLEGCMFIKADEAFDTVRMKENNILREMRKLLELDMVEVPTKDTKFSALGTVAS